MIITLAGWIRPIAAYVASGVMILGAAYSVYDERDQRVRPATPRLHLRGHL
jgi:hypothetical protein